jgi:hypothetical protein
VKPRQEPGGRGVASARVPGYHSLPLPCRMLSRLLDSIVDEYLQNQTYLLLICVNSVLSKVIFGLV